MPLTTRDRLFLAIIELLHRIPPLLRASLEPLGEEDEAVREAILRDMVAAQAMLDGGGWPFGPLANAVRSTRYAATAVGAPTAELRTLEDALTFLRDAEVRGLMADR